MLPLEVDWKRTKLTGRLDGIVLNKNKYEDSLEKNYIIKMYLTLM